MESVLNLNENWVDGVTLERNLSALSIEQFSKSPIFGVNISPSTCIMIDAGVRLLSYANQLSDEGKQVRIDFNNDPAGAYSYLNRIGFFDYLDSKIEILPQRPSFSASKRFKGNNPGVFEIVPIDPRNSPQDSQLPATMTSSLLSNISDQEHKKSLDTPCFTFFAELVENIFLHSQTQLKGFVAYQAYSKGRKIKVVVSDSGVGMIDSLRPSIEELHPEYKDFSDSVLIEKMFAEGISKDGKDKGCGLHSCARQALKFKASIDIRLPKSAFHLTPVNKSLFGYNALGSILDSRIPFKGTHITVDIALD